MVLRANTAAKDIVIGARGLGMNSPPDQIEDNRQQLDTGATFLRSCVAQAPSRGDGPHYSLHASG